MNKAFEGWAKAFGVSPEWDEEHGIYTTQQEQFMFRAWQASEQRFIKMLEGAKLFEAVSEDIKRHPIHVLFNGDKLRVYHNVPTADEVAKAVFATIKHQLGKEPHE